MQGVQRPGDQVTRGSPEGKEGARVGGSTERGARREEGAAIPRAAGLRPGDPPPPRAGPSPEARPRQLAGFSARWTWPGPPRCPPPPSPAHHSEALLASRLRSLGSKNSRHLGAETDGRRWPRPSASWHTAGWQRAGQTSVAPVWPGASLAVEEAGNVAGGPPERPQPHLFRPRPKPLPWSVTCAVRPLGLTPALLLTAHLGQVL